MTATASAWKGKITVWFIRALAGLVATLALVVLIAAPGSVSAGWLVILGAPTWFLLVAFPHRGAVAAVHLLSAAILGALAIGSCGSCGNWPVTIPGLLAHACAAAWWWWRPGTAFYGTGLLGGISLGVAWFASTFGYFCGPCFAVHTLMAVTLFSLAPRLLRGATMDRTIALTALPVAAGALAYIWCAAIPGLARNPDERAILTALQQSGLAVVISPQQLQAAPSAAGIQLGDPQCPRQLDVVVSVGCPACVSEWPLVRSAIGPEVAGGRLGVRLHILPGSAAADPAPMALAGWSAVHENPEGWLDAVQAVIANQQDLIPRQSGRVARHGHQWQADLDTSSRWAAALGIVRSPTFLLRDQGRLVATYSHLDARSIDVIAHHGGSP